MHTRTLSTSKSCMCARKESARLAHFSFRRRSGKLELYSIHAQTTAEMSELQACDQAT